MSYKKLNLSKLFEGELEQSQAIIAAQSVTNKLQDIVGEIAKLQADLITQGIVDNLKTQFSIEQANKFQTVAGEQLAQVLTIVSAAKDQISNELLRLQGQDIPEPGGTMAGDTGGMGAGNGKELPADPFGGAEASSGPVAEPLGRKQKESVEYTRMSESQLFRAAEKGNKVAFAELKKRVEESKKKSTERANLTKKDVDGKDLRKKKKIIIDTDSLSESDDTYARVRVLTPENESHVYWVKKGPQDKMLESALLLHTAKSERFDFQHTKAEVIQESLGNPFEDEKYSSVLTSLESALETESLNEFEMSPTPDSKKGMFDGWTQEELHSDLSKVKDEMKAHEDKGEKVPHALRSRHSELTFALRAKHNWGKVEEAKKDKKKPHGFKKNKAVMYKGKETKVQVPDGPGNLVGIKVNDKVKFVKAGELKPCKESLDLSESFEKEVNLETVETLKKVRPTNTDLLVQLSQTIRRYDPTHELSEDAAWIKQNRKLESKIKTLAEKIAPEYYGEFIRTWNYEIGEKYPSFGKAFKLTEDLQATTPAQAHAAQMLAKTLDPAQKDAIMKKAQMAAAKAKTKPPAQQDDEVANALVDKLVTNSAKIRANGEKIYELYQTNPNLAPMWWFRQEIKSLMEKYQLGPKETIFKMMKMYNLNEGKIAKVLEQIHTFNELTKIQEKLALIGK